jgi:hypothetical protein
MATLIGAHAHNPEAQAKQLGKRLVETVQGPSLSDKVN